MSLFSCSFFSFSKVDHCEIINQPASLAMTTAIFRFEEGKPVICVGKLHSHHFRKLCVGDYPRVSLPVRYVAYNRSLRKGIVPIKVIEVQTGKVRTFDSIPDDLHPWPESFWSKDESLIAFEVHDFDGNRVKCVVSMFLVLTDIFFIAPYRVAGISIQDQPVFLLSAKLSYGTAVAVFNSSKWNGLGAG